MPGLVAIGDNCLDVFVGQDRVTVGGNALNVAAHWRRAGRQARYFGAVGDDAGAELVLAQIAAAGLDPDDVERRAGETAITLVRGEAGERRFVHEALGVGEAYLPSADRYAAARTADWVHLGTRPNPQLIARLAADGVGFSVDLSTGPFPGPADGASVIFASSPDPSAALALLEALSVNRAAIVVVTSGPAGAWLQAGEGARHVPAAPARVVDTCGAGDSFIAAFIGALRQDRLAPTDALTAATRAAALTCGHLGGFPQTPRPIAAGLRARYRDVIGG